MAYRRTTRKIDPKGFPLRFKNLRERRKFARFATAAGLSMNDFARARILNIPLEHLGGKEPLRRRQSTRRKVVEPPVPADPPESFPD